MARTCRCSQNGVSSTNWGPKNTAVVVTSGGKSTSGFDRSRFSGQSALRTSRTMATTFLSHLQDAHPQSSHFTDPQSLSKNGPPPSVKVRVRFGSDLLDVAFTQPRTLCAWSDELKTRYGHPQSMAVQHGGSSPQLSACTDFLSAKGVSQSLFSQPPKSSESRSAQILDATEKSG